MSTSDMAGICQSATDARKELIMIREYFKTECTKCGVLLVVPVSDKSEHDYYLCQSCAFAKVGA
jgi:predicted RNA-binding Zn-ribbon protein involved in translation (DUF1610 family)